MYQFHKDYLGIFQINYKKGWDGGYGKNNQLKVNGVNYPVLAWYPGGGIPFDRWVFLAEGFYDPQDWTLRLTSRQCKEIRIFTTGRMAITDLLYDEKGNLQFHEIP